jgi:hypothetical protein
MKSAIHPLLMNRGSSIIAIGAPSIDRFAFDTGANG